MSDVVIPTCIATIKKETLRISFDVVVVSILSNHPYFFQILHWISKGVVGGTSIRFVVTEHCSCLLTSIYKYIIVILHIRKR